MLYIVFGIAARPSRAGRPPPRARPRQVRAPGQTWGGRSKGGQKMGRDATGPARRAPNFPRESADARVPGHGSDFQRVSKSQDRGSSRPQNAHEKLEAPEYTSLGWAQSAW